MRKVSLAKIENASSLPIHLAFGHELTASAVSIASASCDKFCLTHRNIHFNIALSDSSQLSSIVNETLGLSDGINHGAYGCMSMRNSTKGVVYSSSILANNIPIGLGISSTLSEGVVWIQCGDGSLEEGCFYESLQLASSRNLPVIFVLEDNNWSLGTSIKERRVNTNLRKLCSSLNVLYRKSSSSSISIFVESIYSRFLSSNLRRPIVLHVITTTYGSKPSSTSNRYVSYHHGPIVDFSLTPVTYD